MKFKKKSIIKIVISFNTVKVLINFKHTINYCICKDLINRGGNQSRLKQRIASRVKNCDVLKSTISLIIIDELSAWASRAGLDTSRTR